MLREGQWLGRSPLSPAIATGERIWLSGMLARGDDAEGEARATLASLGGTFEDAEAVLGVIAEVMPEGAPAPTVAGLPLVGRLGVEIQMTAVVR